MRTLQEITDAARRNEPTLWIELQFAVCAYDVLLSQLELENDVPKLTKFMIAAEADPVEYIGLANDPRDPEVAAWHKAFINIDKELKK